MRISLWRIDPRTHGLRVDRERGAPVHAALETRSFLLHDLAHYAVEAEAGTAAGFWGLLDAGVALEDLREPGRLGTEVWDALLEVERAVVLVQTAHRRGAPPPGDARPDPAPPWWDETLLARAGDRLRRLDGAWRKLRQGQTLELSWPVTPPALPSGRRAARRPGPASGSGG